MSYDESILAVPVSSVDHMQGQDGTVTLVEYGDFQCPACAEAHSLIRQIQRHYAGNLNFVFRNFPLNEIHPLARLAAEAAEGAATLSDGEYWSVHDWLFENQPLWTAAGAEGLQRGFKDLGLDTSRLESAMREPDVTGRVEQDFMGGVRSGVNGTPSFFINGRQYYPNGSGSLARAIGNAIAKMH